MAELATGGVAHTAPVAIAGPAHRGLWDEFVASHPDAAPEHLFGWSAVVGRVYGKACFPLYATRQECWAGVFPLVHMTGRLGGDRLVSLPYLDRGGILADSAEAGEALLAAARELASRLGARGVESRGAALAGATGTPGVERSRWLLSLAGSREELWRRLGGKVRNQIRKSEKVGLVTRRESVDELPAFYRVFARNMRDLGSPVHAFTFFREICEIFGPRVGLYLTRDPAGQPVAGALAFSFRRTTVVPWASALRAARPSCPNHSLYWTVLQDASDGGAVLFDFGRSTRGSGTERFKRQWGCRAVPLEWSYLDLRGGPCPETLTERSYASRLMRLWRHLPLPVANRLGPAIRGRLPL